MVRTTLSADSVTIHPIPNYNGDLNVDVKVSDGEKEDMKMVYFCYSDK